MARRLTALLRADPARPVESLGEVRLRELPDDATTAALLDAANPSDYPLRQTLW